MKNDNASEINKNKTTTSNSLDTSVSNSVKNTQTNMQNINNIVPSTNSSSTTPSTSSSTSTTASNENKINDVSASLQNINTIILQGIQGANSIQDEVANMNSVCQSNNQSANTNNTSNISISDSIDKASTILGNINNIKEQLAKLPLNPAELAYFDNSVNPILTILHNLSTISYNLSSSATTLATSPTVCGKRHDLKDTINLVYDINEECEDVFDVLKCRIDTLLKLGQC